ncbi:hypothetical protein ATANTOWER_013156 [Ataeniobius toweri]|uniref:Uncharacterized protein n=1 Tax=Ataeniobius toweri TaxID=208326 RepID=A0ABU7APU2_9TELE|nr:hypothetical protein [Ataeniobius toweri]
MNQSFVQKGIESNSSLKKAYKLRHRVSQISFLISAHFRSEFGSDFVQPSVIIVCGRAEIVTPLSVFPWLFQAIPDWLKDATQSIPLQEPHRHSQLLRNIHFKL